MYSKKYIAEKSDVNDVEVSLPFFFFFATVIIRFIILLFIYNNN